MTKQKVKRTVVTRPDNPRETIIGWMKPEVDAEGNLTGEQTYVQELIPEVTSSEVDENGVLTVEFGKGDHINLAPGVWYFERNFQEGRPDPEATD